MTTSLDADSIHHRLQGLVTSFLTPASDTLVSYENRRVLLIYGPADRVNAALSVIDSSVFSSIAVCSNDKEVAASRSKYDVAIVSSTLNIEGYLGSFKAFIEFSSGPSSLAPLSPHTDGTFDLILDLQVCNPTLRGMPLPLGYFWQGGNVELIAETVSEVINWPGLYHKKLTVGITSQPCSHLSHEISGCNLCEEVCPVNAISFKQIDVAIDTLKCIECAECSSVCPTSTIVSIAYSIRQVISLLSGATEVLAQEGYTLPCIELREGGDITLTLDGPTLSLVLPNCHNFGLETWLSILALGYPQLITASEVSGGSLAADIEFAKAVLAQCGIEPFRIGIHYDERAGKNFLIEKIQYAEGLPFTKRTLLKWALKHLIKYPECDRSVSAVLHCIPKVYGGLNLDKSACTQCFSCELLCPQKALEKDEEQGCLIFKEALCTQCEICVKGCPEKALGMVEGFRLNQYVSSIPEILFESDNIKCKECSSEFMPKVMYDRLCVMLGDEIKSSMALCSKCKQSHSANQQI
jgi:ferredoxin